MRTILIIWSLLLLSSCYKTLSLDGFDKQKWKTYRKECSSYRLTSSPLLLKNESLILEATQNEVESLLGAADEHELYERNQKFFHYYLTPDDSCGFVETKKVLSIRFNAIGRANDIQIIRK